MRSRAARRSDDQSSSSITRPSDLLERVPAVIYIAEVGHDARWLYVSPQIEHVLGFTPDEWYADRDLWATRLHPDDHDWVIAAEDCAHGDDSGRPVEYRMIHRDGRVVWLRDDAQLVADGGVLRWHGVLSDITERMQVEIELERRAAQQAAVARLGEHALEGATTEELMQEAVDAAGRLLKVDLAAVAELMEARGVLVLRTSFGLPAALNGADLAPTGTGSQAGYTVLTRAPVVVTDWSTETRFQQPPLISRRQMRSGASVIIEGRSGPFGMLGVQSRSPRQYSAGDVDFLQSLANVLADALERQRTEDDIRHRALHDALTGLPNRVLFGDRLEQALERRRRRGSTLAILFLDLDEFKLVNDGLGHQFGDQLLAAAAVRIKQAVRATDTVARFGGDEFGILLEEIAGEHEAAASAERIAALFVRPFAIAGREQFVTASIGIVVARSDETAEGLIRDADAAMYRAKSRGRARFEVFDREMRAGAVARLQVENDLRHALDNDELLLAYQPIVSLRTERVVGVEALARWRHPERGLVPPDEFIPVAEANGLIEPIGAWVLEQACRQAAKWYHARPDAAPIGMSVNISAKQLDRHRLPELISRLLREVRLDPACLSLEITESVMIGNAETLAETLQALKRIGVRLVLDDFGTGYSSFGYLTHLPLDALKIDRSYVDGVGTDARDTAITEAIVAMSHALSLEVIAEGVETPGHVAALRRVGCELAQGYHFSRPASAAAVTAIVDGQHQSPDGTARPAAELR